MARLGDLPANEITTRNIERVLQDVADAGRGPTTVNKYRALLSSIFTYAGRGSTYALASNPVRDADRRRQPPPQEIEFYSVEEVEALARALAAGAHRGTQRDSLSDAEVKDRGREDQQDAELVRVAAYTGLRRSEIVALLWQDVDFGTRQVHVRSTVSAGIKVDAPKSGKRRSVPMTDRALGALDRLSLRDAFIGRRDHVAVGSAGGRIDADAFGKRVGAVQEKAGLRRLALHGLRHSFASQLVAAGLGLATSRKARAREDRDDRAVPSPPPGERARRGVQSRAERRSPSGSPSDPWRQRRL